MAEIGEQGCRNHCYAAIPLHWAAFKDGIDLDRTRNPADPVRRCRQHSANVAPPADRICRLLTWRLHTHPFTASFFWIMVALVAISLVLDHVVPIWDTKRFGGAKVDIRGRTPDFLLVFWTGAWGIVPGPFLGLVDGEMLAGQCRFSPRLTAKNCSLPANVVLPR